MKSVFKNLIKSSLALAVGLCLLSEASITPAWAEQGGVNVYVVFSGKDKKDKTALKKAFSGHLTVKFYNVDLLALADYSGKQKAIAKLERARVILVVRDVPHELLEGASMKSKVVIFNSAKRGVQSENKTLYIVDKGVTLGGEVKTQHATTAADLVNADALKAADAVVVDGAMDIYNAVVLIVGTML